MTKLPHIPEPIGTYTARDIAIVEPFRKHNQQLQEANTYLLKTLEQMVALYESGAWSSVNVSDARAAIAKARGEA